jgi:hypothetical protein
MPDDERAALSRIALENLPPLLPPPSGALGQKPDIPALPEWVDVHLFERNAVLADHQFFAAARGRGEDFSLADLEQAVVARGYAISTDGRKVTHRGAPLHGVNNNVRFIQGNAEILQYSR